MRGLLVANLYSRKLYPNQKKTRYFRQLTLFLMVFMDNMIFNSSAAAVLFSAGADPNLCGPRGISPLGRIIGSIQEPDISNMAQNWNQICSSTLSLRAYNSAN